MADFPRSSSSTLPQDDLLTGPVRNDTAGEGPSSTGGRDDGLAESAPPSSDGSMKLFLVSVLLGLIFLCCIMVVLIVRSRLRKQRLPPNRNANGGADGNDDGDTAARKRKVLEDRIQRRFETIEAWLVTKQVLRHDDACDRIVRNRSLKGRSDRGCNEAKDVEKGGDSHGVECPICMGVMKPNEWASWSANVDCTHVFHRDCIKPWLLKRMDCPCCRSELLAVDKVRGMEEKCNAIHRLSQEHQQRSSLTYCCDCHGLVILRSEVEWSDLEADEIRIITNRGMARSSKAAEVIAPRKHGSDGHAAAANGGEGGGGRPQSLVIGRTESDDEGETKPEETETNPDVELGSGEC